MKKNIFFHFLFFKLNNSLFLTAIVIHKAINIIIITDKTIIVQNIILVLLLLPQSFSVNFYTGSYIYYYVRPPFCSLSFIMSLRFIFYQKKILFHSHNIKEYNNYYKSWFIFY